MASDKGKQERFEKLYRQYSIALVLTDSLIDSGILDTKIKVTQKNVDVLRASVLVGMAAELRAAEEHSTVFDFDKFDHLAIINAYLDELRIRGSEWQHADLQDLFLKEKQLYEEDDD